MQKDHIDELYQKAIDYFESKDYEVANGSDSHTDYGHSRYFYVNQNEESKENSGLGFQVRVSDHSATSNRRVLSEYFIMNEKDIPNTFHIFNRWFHPEQYENVSKTITDSGFPQEVNEKFLRPTDEIISERENKKGQKVYTIRRIRMIDGFIPTHIESGYKLPFRPNNPDIRFDKGGQVNSNSFMKWCIDWYKGVSDKMNIAFSLPNAIQPFKEKNAVILDVFEKKNQTINAEPYLKKIVEKANEYDVVIYLEPKDEIEQYEKFGFQLTPNKQFMKRLPHFSDGGSVKRYNKEIMKKVKKGGITYGNSHAEGGIPVKNASTGDMLEVEGGEGIVNKRSMASDKKVKLNGKDMSLCEAVSQLNQMEGGVQFNCDDVADRQFLEEMALGGELERGTRTEKEHIQVLNDLYAKRITPTQATRRIAKDHIKEDSRYYSKLAKMEGKMADGGYAEATKRWNKKAGLPEDGYRGKAKQFVKENPEMLMLLKNGGKIADVDNLEGSIVKIYDAGVKDPIFFVVKSAKMSDPSFRYKTLFLTSSEGYVEEIDDTKIEAFLRGEQIQMKTKGTNDYYALQLTNKKMKLKHGGKTEDCGCGLTYAEGGFVEDNTPLEVGDVVYVIEKSKPRNEWLSGVYVTKVGNDAQIVITDADANQYEKVLPFEDLIKLDIAQANPSDFKEFIEDFGKAKNNYFENISALAIIEDRIAKAKKFPHPNPTEQTKIMDDLKKELSKAKSSAEQGKKDLSGLSGKPSAFYRYDKGGMVSVDNVKSVLDGLSTKVFDLGYIKLNEKKLGNDFSTIYLQDLSIPVTDRDKWVARYSYSIKDIPSTKIEFYISQESKDVIVKFPIATRNLQRKSGMQIYDLIKKLGFQFNDAWKSEYIYTSILAEGKSKIFIVRFGEKYYNLFKSGSAIADLIEYFKVIALMLILPIPYQGLEKRDGQTISDMREVFANGEIETNEKKEGGEGGAISYWRFKTEQEFKDELGDNWRINVGWASDGDMDYLLGQRIEDFRLVHGKPKLGSVNTKDAYGIASGVDDDWIVNDFKFFKLVAYEEGGSEVETKINKFLELYSEEFLNPRAWKPKSGESEVRGILKNIQSDGLITKAEWDGCVKRAKIMNDLAEKVKDLPADSVLYKVLVPKIYEQAEFLTETGIGLGKAYDKRLSSYKLTDDEKTDFPLLMMKIWQHEPSLDSSIFE